MATREENLKKINAELEQLSDDDLEKIAGGTLAQSADDSRFLNVLLQGTQYHHCDRYGEFRMFCDLGACNDLRDAWQSLGITLCDDLGDNSYYMNGKEISRSDAWAHAEKLVGRHLNKSDWDW